MITALAVLKFVCEKARRTGRDLPIQTVLIRYVTIMFLSFVGWRTIFRVLNGITSDLMG